MAEVNIIEPTADDIAAWKTKHGDVYAVSIDGKTAYLKKPSRKSIGFSMSAKDPIKAKEILLKDMWVGGDETMLVEDSYFLGLAGQVDSLIEIKEAEVVKL